MKNDRFLVGILIGIAAITVLALVLFFTNRQEADYLPDDSPENVVQNYVLALYKGDDDRAFGYLSAREGQPVRAAFRTELAGQRMEYSNTSMQVIRADIDGDEAVVSLRVARGGGGLFTQPYRETTTALLARENGEWKIYFMPYPYWGWSWYQATPTEKFLP